VSVGNAVKGVQRFADPLEHAAPLPIARCGHRLLQSASSSVRNWSAINGMIESASNNDTITAMVSVDRKERQKTARQHPVSNRSGRNTTTVVRVEVVTGQISSCTACLIASCRFGLIRRCRTNVFGDDNGIVDHESDRDRHRSQRHQVECLTNQIHGVDADRERQWNRRKH